MCKNHLTSRYKESNSIVINLSIVVIKRQYQNENCPLVVFFFSVDMRSECKTKQISFDTAKYIKIEIYFQLDYEK